jgi:hypothetical protein
MKLLSSFAPAFVVFALGLATIQSATAAPWVTNGPLHIARFSLTATLLLNG